MNGANNAKKFSAIPENACQFAGGEVAVGSNGDGAKTAPVRIKARSGQPLEHWFWGRVVHDLAGMRMHKSRLTIDYAHNDSEVLGYLNHFDTESGDLMAAGAIIPFADGDRASEVLFKMREGVPYEASIFFGGDGIKVQEVAEGEVSPVNGYEFAGPGVIIREWPLRGVAICPYGADANTESVALSNGQTYAAQAWATSEGDGEMDTEQTAEAVDVQANDEATELAVDAIAVEAEADATEQDAEAQTEGAENADLTEARADSEGESIDVDATALEADQEAVDSGQSAMERQIAELTAALQAAMAARAEMEVRLAALEAGASPVSANAAHENDSELTPWQKAQRRNRRQ